MNINSIMPLPCNGFEDIKKRSLENRICGVYVLSYNNRVIYVGQSVDVESRIVVHKSEKPYNRCLVKKLPEESLTEFENALITVLQPPLNRMGVLQENYESEYAHRLVALADLVKRVAVSNSWHDAEELAKAEVIIREQAAAVAKKHSQQIIEP